ncbi:helix-turn-helix domain-containing protein [Frisingicoccus sp.]|jgi:transcriptional regulator with XRE-family HTH domain|uniref:helix-turn-helix domain-containing protein n=1 Tax=Frisingicoccus sp. TaxID=1918627 RepID=UPI002E786152|nr:helix-turn-helix domain-containing protein [Frisingicoccus sp.]MEE0752131.1 helix-turn-helix domain-containing protein [Frisingicoccus sp.]
MFSKIEELCRKKGITITELERELGFGRGTILKWKNSSPSVNKLRDVAKYFRVTVDFLIK